MNWSEGFIQLLNAKKDPRDYLQDVANREDDPIERYAILMELAHQHWQRADLDSAEKSFNDCIDISPDAPTSWFSIAKFYAEGRRDYDSALRCANVGISDKTHLSSGMFLYAHCSRMEIAIAIGRRDIADESLKEILAYRDKSAIHELTPTVVPGLKALGVSFELIQQYQQLLGSKAKSP